MLVELNDYDRITLAELARAEADICRVLCGSDTITEGVRRVIAHRASKLEAVADRLWPSGGTEHTTTGGTDDSQ